LVNVCTFPETTRRHRHLLPTVTQFYANTPVKFIAPKRTILHAANLMISCQLHAKVGPNGAVT